jgi:transposase
MGRHKDMAPIARLEVVELGRRRRWTDKAKLRIVEESFAGPRRVSATARRHGISRSLLTYWRKAYRAGRLTEPGLGGFIPAVMVDEPARSAPATSRLEIVTRNGYRVVIAGAVDEAALARILAVLARA